MYSYFFRNKLALLAFAAFIIIGAMVLIGTEEDEGILQETAETIAGQRATLDKKAVDLAHARTGPADYHGRSRNRQHSAGRR